MQLALPSEALANYRSNSQRARIATESWAHSNLYCPNCDSPNLVASPANTPAIDFACPNCRAPFQLKSQSRAFGRRIVDAGYSAMVREIQQDRTPNLFALQYSISEWTVAHLMLIPRFAFPLSAVERRKPLRASAARAGWVGCNILLHAIPPDARIVIVANGVARPPAAVRRQYTLIQPLAKIEAKQRGWTLDVLNAIRALGKPRFTLSDLYGTERRLREVHPGNRHIRDKIRQQLQILRDLGLLQFIGRGEYRLGP